MLAFELSEFMIELKEGSINNVGPATKESTAKLFSVDSASVREFGDKRVKLVFDDEEGNEVQIALFPETVERLQEDLNQLTEESQVFE